MRRVLIDELVDALRSTTVALEEAAKIIAPNFPSLARNVLGEAVQHARVILAKVDAQ